MPSVGEQLAIEGSASPGRAGREEDTISQPFYLAQFLTEPGAGYETSVEKYSPYTEIKDVVGVSVVMPDAVGILLRRSQG